MRAHGGSGAEPQATGTPSHRSSEMPRYCTALLTGPYCLTSASMTSFTGASLSAYWWDAHWSKARTSCPLRACASAAWVRMILLPADAMKSIVTSTLFLAAHSSTRPFSTAHADQALPPRMRRRPPGAPDALRQLAGSGGRLDMDRRQARADGASRGLQRTATGDPTDTCHELLLPVVRASPILFLVSLTGSVPALTGSCPILRKD